MRLKAARSLGAMRIKRAVGAIAVGLQHMQANLRKECASALGEIADPAAQPFLKAAANDPDPEVRKNVRWALQRVGKSGRVAG